MRLSLRRTPPRTAAAAIGLAAAVAVAVPAVASPSPAARPAAARSASSVRPPAAAADPVAVPPSGRVRLLTGDVVVVAPDSQGHPLVSLTPSSPHYGRPVRTYSFAGRTYVVPRLPVRVLRQLDPSVFDVSSALRAARAGTAALRVTFPADATVRALPGLRLHQDAAKRFADGTQVVPADVAGRLGRLPAGVRVSGTTSSIQQAPGDYELFTVTLKSEQRPGTPTGFAFVEYMNVEDGGLAAGFGFIDHGEWKVSLPAGHYWAAIDGFSRVVVHEFTVSGDMTESFLETEATVRPAVTVEGQHPLESGFTIIRSAEAGGVFSLQFGGPMRVNPVATPPAGLGTLTLTAEATTAASGLEGRFAPQPLTFARAYTSGIPAHFTRHYRPGDFATVPVRIYGTGNARPGGLELAYAAVPQSSGAFVTGWPVRTPGTTTARLLGDPTLTWTTMAASELRFTHLQQITHRYHPGPAAPVDFYRGPNGPGYDRGFERDAPRQSCALCLSQGELLGWLPSTSSAGTPAFGFSFLDGSPWSLRGGHRVLAEGDGVLWVRADAPAAGTELTLTATSSPGDPWTLSTKVKDTWTFTVPGSDGAIPMLRADYVPPTSIDSTMPPGPVSFPITFDNLGPTDARVTAASVEWSTNGRSWTKADLTRVDANTFRVSYTNPASGVGGGTVSFRIAARDASGRTVQEQADDAYALAARATAARASRGTAAAAFDARHLCRTARAGSFGCFARLQRWNTGPTAKDADPAGWGASDLRDAYDVPATGSTATVGIVVAGNYPTAQQDLNTYRAQFGLPPCTAANGCFTKINQKGEHGNYPRGDMNWGVEAALDLQMVTAACPTCHIILGEGNSPSVFALNKTTKAVMAAGATVTNHSYGINEFTGIAGQGGVYDRPGVTSVVSSGDFGYTAASYPASVPGVVSVGGTVLSRSGDPRGWSETAWEGGGSGCSAYFAKPAYQSDTACHMRTFTDSSAVAWDVAVYDTFLPRRYAGWLKVGGTSASSPFTAGLIGAAGAGGLKPGALYSRASAFTDITSGSNGFCRGNYMCTALPGWDAPTGWGTPHGIDPFTP